MLGLRADAADLDAWEAERQAAIAARAREIRRRTVAPSDLKAIRAALTRVYGPPLRGDSVDYYGACPVCRAGDGIFRPIQVGDAAGLFCAANWCDPKEIAALLARDTA